MSLLGKKEDKKMPTPRHKKSFITPSLHLCFSNTLYAEDVLSFLEYKYTKM